MARLFRIVKTDPPTLDDFKSQAGLGMPRPPNVSERDWSAVSVRTSLAGARSHRKRVLEGPAKKNLGDYISEIDIPDTADQGQIGRDPEHIGIWEPAEDLLATVVSTVAAVP